MLEGKGRYQIAKSKTGIVYIPARISMDSQFPFTDKQVVNIKVEGKRMVIEWIIKDFNKGRNKILPRYLNQSQGHLSNGYLIYVW